MGMVGSLDDLWKIHGWVGYDYDEMYFTWMVYRFVLFKCVSGRVQNKRSYVENSKASANPPKKNMTANGYLESNHTN
jgi:hypothetical protein